MKKLLLSTVAIGALALASVPAFAAEEGGVKLELGGYFKGYLGYLDQDKLANINLDTDTGVGDDAGVTAGAEVESTGWLQDSEIHFTGETELDTGLTVGVRFEMNTDRNDSDTDESYAYFSGDWGRVNAGSEDGAAFLLQVAAPSADDNYDGIRQYISPFNYAEGVVGAVNIDYGDDNLPGGSGGNADTAVSVTGALEGRTTFDYAQDPTANNEKITYLSPIFSGFQAGVSYIPDSDNGSSNSIGFDTEATTGLGDGFEGAVRYSGSYNDVGMIFGAGYSLLDSDDSSRDSRDVWNVGASFTYKAFTLGGAYKNDDQENLGDRRDMDTWVVGADYTNGPFKVGASYFNENENLTATTELDTNRYTGGVVYTYGPGMSFRGSVSYVDHDQPVLEDVSGTTVLVGTQINF